MISTHCAVCNSKKTRFIREQERGLMINLQDDMDLIERIKSDLISTIANIFIL